MKEKLVKGDASGNGKNAGRFCILTSLDQTRLLTRCLLDMDSKDKDNETNDVTSSESDSENTKSTTSFLIEERRSVTLGKLEAVIFLGRISTSKERQSHAPKIKSRFSWEKVGGRGTWLAENLEGRGELETVSEEWTV